MTVTTVGILHPGQMGVTVGAAVMAAGGKAVWASDGRGAETSVRAEAAGIEDLRTLAAVVDASSVLISVCPPSAAGAVADEVAAGGFTGTFVDANAVSPETALRVATTITAAGATYVDGGIIGPPARREGTTRLYLSGADASAVAALFEGSLLDARVIGSDPTAASALKMCYAAYTKGSSALLIAIRALATHAGVDEALTSEWDLSQDGLRDRSGRAAKSNAFKAWRFAGEMLEIASTFEAAGLPGGFHGAASEVYERLAEYKNCDPPPELDEVLDTLLNG